MRAAEIVTYLQDQGFSVGLSKDRQRISVYPAPQENIIARLRARREDVLAYLRELDEAPQECRRFVALRSADPESIRARGACIACGWPFVAHRDPPIEEWWLVDDANEVALVTAASVVAVAAASYTAENAS